MHIPPRPRRLAAPRLLVFAALALSLASCETITRNVVPDQPPTVTLTSGPIDTASTPQAWNVRIEWTASDPDGRVDHFEYAVDPPSHKQATLAAAETAWVSTHEPGVTVHFTATRRDTAAVGSLSRTFHVFALRAIDDRGGVSPLVVRAFYATTVAPDVQITRPVPSVFLAPAVPLPFRIDWHGHDADGEGAGDPVGYRYRVVDMNDYARLPYLVDPDSLLREGEASGWAGWRSVPGESTSAVVTSSDLPSYGNGLFALVAVDAAGATTPYLMLDRNGIYFQSSLSNGASGPRIHIYSALFDFTYASGGYSTDPAREIPIEFGAHTPITFHIDGTAAPGRTVVSVRWLVDGNPGDETPRTGPDDIHHWSTPAPPPIEITIPGLDQGVHRLDVELVDDFGDKSLGIVRITTVGGALNHDLLVVNDTRLEPDHFLGGVLQRSTQPWPSRAELDTFLFARGGVPWRSALNPTTGVLSPPGLLAGYPFDTLGTQLGLESPALGVPLSKLSQYRHVIWLVDDRGAAYTPALDQNIFPITALLAMSGPGLVSSLAAYVQMGGEVWLAGGGAGYASLALFDRRANNSGQLTVFTASDGELGPGRPMYDAAHVRSSLGVTKASFQVARSPAAAGGWSGHGPDGTLAAPDYSRAPASMRMRDASTDPLPPTRVPGQEGLFYRTIVGAGFVLEPNSITEDFDPDPNVTRVESALDTVYDATSGTLGIQSAPVMLYYHGRDNAPFVYTGFSPWDFTREDGQGLVDFVLGDIWKLPKSPGGAVVRASATTPPPALRSTSDVARHGAVRLRR